MEARDPEALVRGLVDELEGVRAFQVLAALAVGAGDDPVVLWVMTAVL